MTPKPSAASTGGSGGASGVGFQNLVFGWSASSLIAEEPLLHPLVAGTVLQVGAQTGFAVDDVAAVTDLDNMAFFQAKVGLSLGSTEDSPLAEALQQAVGQFLNGQVPQPGANARHFDATRDAIVLCTNSSAPATVRKDLANAVRRVASQPRGTPFGAELTYAQTTAINVALTHVGRAWLNYRDAGPADDELRTFFKALHVLTLDLDEGRGDQQAAITVLHRTLPDASRAAEAWTELVKEGQAASEAREWRDRSALALALSRRYIALAPPAKHAADIHIIRERTAANLRAMHKNARLPVPDGGVYIARSAAKTLRAADRQHALIIGDAGSGKSAVAQDLATSRSTDEEVVVLRATDLAGINRLQTQAPLQEVLRAWIGLPGLIVVDGVDALRGSEDRETLSGIVSALHDTRWQVVATARTFDTRHSHPLRRAFAGSPVATQPGMFDQRLADVRHLFVGDLTDDDLDREITAPMAMASVLAEASQDLRALLRNPFNLSLAAELADGLTTGQHAELLQVRSRVELLDRYWEWRVRNHDRLAREALLKRLSSDMVKRRSLQTVEQEPTVIGTDSTALESLLSQGVLTALDGAIPGVGRILTFSHNILFDYATAIYVLYRPLGAAEVTEQLDEDPTLPLVARPSFDMLVDLLWQSRSAGAFWPVALQVAGSKHDLASLAIASRIANLVRDAGDLLDLVPKPGDTNSTTNPLPRHKLISQLAGAVCSRTVLPAVNSAIVPLATLARRLANNASNSKADGALAIDLIRTLQNRAPIAADGCSQQADDERADAIAALLDACRSNSLEMEDIAEAVARQLKYVIGFSLNVREAVGRLLEDEATLAQWGGTVLQWFPDAVPPTLTPDPQLARRLAEISVKFQETRDDDVAFSASTILVMKESRRQQASRAVLQLGEIFPQICDIDIVSASEIVCDILENDEDAPTARKWPISAYGQEGYVDDGYGYSLTPHTYQAEQKMLVALSAALPTVPPAAASAAVSVLAKRMHSAFGWAALLNQPNDISGLGRTMLPILESGALLVHPDTFPRAASLLKATALAGGGSSAQIETAIANAINLAEKNKIGEYTKNVLLGCLGESDISDPALAQRREDLAGAPPEIPPPLSILSETSPWSLIDYLKKQGVPLTESVESAAHNLDAVLKEFQRSASPSPATTARLIEAFMTADSTFTEAQSVPLELWRLLVNVAARLAYASATTPDSPHGMLVLKVLDDGAAHPNAGSFLE